MLLRQVHRGEPVARIVVQRGQRLEDLLVVAELRKSSWPNVMHGDCTFHEREAREANGLLDHVREAGHVGRRSLCHEKPAPIGQDVNSRFTGSSMLP
ncbi:MAG: hypothetical protein IPK07_03195 [Deltaproteobacteria bacterium]|nr:hypothetical protein [Deltaproteobacteria bacterium]